MVLAIVPGNVVLFLLGMSWWGFAWWMALPGALRMLAERSLLPDERAGHAQGLMAIGRAVSPMIGGAFADAGAYGALSVVAGSGLFAGGGALVAVQEGRDRLPPTDPRVAG
jgi:predicted MFS family arabinose efflux permease